MTDRKAALEALDTLEKFAGRSGFDVSDLVVTIRAALAPGTKLYAAPPASPEGMAAPQDGRYLAQVHLLGPVGEVQVRFVSRHHIKNSPTEANPSPIRVILVADLQAVTPQATAQSAAAPSPTGGEGER